MANIGVYIELKEGQPKKACQEILTLARQSQADIYAIVFGPAAQTLLEKVAGVHTVIQVSGADLTYQPDRYAQTLADLAREFQLHDLIGSCSAQGRDLFPRLAAKLDAGLIHDCLTVDITGRTAVKPIFAGKLLADYKLSGEFRLYTVRPNVIPIAAADAGHQSQPRLLTRELSQAEVKVKIREIKKSAAKKIDLNEAEIIVSGGRAMKAKENFAILEDLAQVLKAGVGASRAAVDAGFATSDMQVGQTGKVVNPKLYIACGISGSIQHFVGMKTSKVIVAINKDPEAPIFKKADYGIVADLFTVVPLLKEEFKKVL